MKITLDEFIAHWTIGTPAQAQPFISHFERAIFDFTTLAGEYTKKKFQSSFDSKSFIGTGSAWKPRHSEWATRKPTHDMMHDTGTLSSTNDKVGILSKQPLMSHTFLEQAPSPGHRKIYRKGSYYYIYTKARSTNPNRKHRGLSTKSDQSYAAIHNTGPEGGIYRVNQRPGAGPPERRQFIGFHPVIDEHVRELIPDIFDEFPLH